MTILCWSHRAARLGPLLLAAFLSAVAGPASARADYTAWQEITVFTVSRLESAAACGFTINGKKLNMLLRSADLSLDAVHSGPRSTALQQRIVESARLFQTDREIACAKIWDQFGDDAVPGARGLLQR